MLQVFADHCIYIYIYAEGGEKMIPLIQKLKIFESIAATETSSYHETAGFLTPPFWLQPETSALMDLYFEHSQHPHPLLSLNSYWTHVTV